MNVKILLTGVAVAVLAAGAAASQATPAAGSSDSSSSMSAPTDASATAAKPKAHKKHMASNERRASHMVYAPPDQPIPYAQLDQYLKASPSERMAMAQQANTGTTADTSATAPAASTTPH